MEIGQRKSVFSDPNTQKINFDCALKDKKKYILNYLKQTIFPDLKIVLGVVLA